MFTSGPLLVDTRDKLTKGGGHKGKKQQSKKLHLSGGYWVRPEGRVIDNVLLGRLTVRTAFYQKQMEQCFNGS